MALRPLQNDELLLAVLRALEQRSMSEAELVADLDAALGREYRLVRRRVLVALAALEAEGLVQAATVHGSPVYRITREGQEAVSRRGHAPVLGEVDQAARPGGGPERSHEFEQVTILFTDVVGSTDLLDRLGDDAAHRLRRRHFALLRRAIRDHDGREVKSLGDGLMVVFGTAQDAVACALAMQRAVASGEDPLELRIGIASGKTLREDDDYFGRPVIVAQRLCDAAGGGDVLIPEPTRELVAGSVAQQLEPRGPLVLKGLSEPVSASAVRVLGLALSA
jgi:class 3 adenylate cyclase